MLEVFSFTGRLCLGEFNAEAESAGAKRVAGLVCNDQAAGSALRTVKVDKGDGCIFAFFDAQNTDIVD